MIYLILLGSRRDLFIELDECKLFFFSRRLIEKNSVHRIRFASYRNKGSHYVVIFKRIFGCKDWRKILNIGNKIGRWRYVMNKNGVC